MSDRQLVTEFGLWKSLHLETDNSILFVIIGSFLFMPSSSLLVLMFTKSLHTSWTQKLFNHKPFYLYNKVIRSNSCQLLPCSVHLDRVTTRLANDMKDGGYRACHWKTGRYGPSIRRAKRCVPCPSPTVHSPHTMDIRNERNVSDTSDVGPSWVVGLIAYVWR